MRLLKLLDHITIEGLVVPGLVEGRSPTRWTDIMQAATSSSTISNWKMKAEGAVITYHHLLITTTIL